MSDSAARWSSIIDQAERVNARLAKCAVSGEWDEFNRELAVRDRLLAQLNELAVESLPQDESLALSRRLQQLGEQNQHLVALAQTHKQQLQQSHRQTVKGDKAVKAYQKT
ncbi:flagellar protein FliT [Gilvimarinus sp. DA14]|uniref:flagellar protein FliT n=1 Tax=Gilvimarinus sp. DA14 TaxID=2956798 RepID=UPI0020B84924|nr:flagellar protein FliT [Gilvimarinus sp. DA14]UTF60807.1 flagellar protein FliT [Gilvimarinus sp. DA14]